MNVIINLRVLQEVNNYQLSEECFAPMGLATHSSVRE
jgi:hypothetical protein